MVDARSGSDNTLRHAHFAHGMRGKLGSPDRLPLSLAVPTAPRRPPAAMPIIGAPLTRVNGRAIRAEDGRANGQYGESLSADNHLRKTQH